MKARNIYLIVGIILITATIIGCGPSEEGEGEVSGALEDAVIEPGPLPTETSLPENTATAEPTPEPTLTSTPTSFPTDTPKPTETPKDTSTPTMTPTDEPTSTPTPPPLPEIQILNSSVNVRSGPGTNYAALSTLSEGEVVVVIATNNDGSWYNILLPDGSTGWLAASVSSPISEESLDLVSVAATIPAPPSPSPTEVEDTPAQTPAPPAPGPGTVVLTFINQTPNRDVDIVLSYEEMRFPVLIGETVVIELPIGDHRVEIQSGSCWRGLPNVIPENRAITYFFLPTEGECDWYVSIISE